MSDIKINPFYEFCRVKTMNYEVDAKEKIVTITASPDERYKPICHKCKKAVDIIHSRDKRTVRDLSILDMKTHIIILYRTVKCPKCGIVVEDTGLMDPYMRVTKRLINQILGLCRYMNIKDIAEYLALDWKTVKTIHKNHLVEKFANEENGISELLAVDEVSLKKRHKYLTIIINWRSGKVLWVGEGRKYETLKAFFDSLSDEQKKSIKAVAMDMWDPYIKAVKESCPDAAIVFDQFHVIKAFSAVINNVRNSEYRKADRQGKEVIKGSKYILLKNKENLDEKEKVRLKALLEVNQAITTAYILKDYLKKLWDYKYSACAKRFLEQWCEIAKESGIRYIISFAKTLKRHAYGIINHCLFPINTSRLEGINNKIKVIKRKAYGFHDITYFSLVIKDAFNQLIWR